MKRGLVAWVLCVGIVLRAIYCSPKRNNQYKGIGYVLIILFVAQMVIFGVYIYIRFPNNFLCFRVFCLVKCYGNIFTQQLRDVIGFHCDGTPFVKNLHLNDPWAYWEAGSILGGGFKHFLCSPLGKWSHLNNIFQMGWFNHQPVLFSRPPIFCKQQTEIHPRLPNCSCKSKGTPPRKMRPY